MPSSISLLIAYPKELIRAGLRAMLAGSPVKIVGEASDAPGALTLAKKHKPDVVLLDAGIPDGDAFKLVTKLAKALPATKCVLLTALDNPTYMARAHTTGAANCLLKSVSRKELISAIDNAAAGKAGDRCGAVRQDRRVTERSGQGSRGLWPDAPGGTGPSSLGLRAGQR